GKSWTRHRAPFPLNSRIQALVAHPKEAHTVLAAGDTGLFVSHDGGARWERVGVVGTLPTIWSLTIDPVDPDILFAGTRPAGVYRSRDGGRQWQKLAVDIAPECSIGIPFVTGIVVDPDDHHTVWAGVEIDGVFRSRDGGDSWTHLKTGLYDPDIHAVTIAATEPKRLYASTAREVFTSDDLGESWEPLGIKEKWPLPYARGMAVKADDPSVLFAGCGETTTGETGLVLRTTNFGESWEILPLPTQLVRSAFPRRLGRLERPDMQKKRRDQRVFQCGLRLGHFRANARFAKAFDDQPGLDDEVDPPAQSPVKPGNTERLRLITFLLRGTFKPKGIDPPIGRI